MTEPEEPAMLPDLPQKSSPERIGQAVPALTAAQQFGTPRRFGIGTLLVVTAAASLILAMLVALGAPALVVLHVIGFLFLLGICQAVLFKGKDPRLASILSGTAICVLYVVILVPFVLQYYIPELRKASRGSDGFGFICLLIFSPVLGYLGGAIVGGIFLLMDRWEQRFGRRKLTGEPETYDPFAPVKKQEGQAQDAKEDCH